MGRMSKPKSLRWYSAMKWQVRAAAAATLVGALLSPKAAWARTLHRVASRGQERQAALFTVGIIVLLFMFAWLNSKKEDSSEDTRIRAEVERLVRLKKEFEETTEAAEAEGTDDDSIAASLRAAQQSMAEKQQEDEGKDGAVAGDGVGGEDSSAGDTGDVKSGDSSKSEDDSG